MLGFRLLMSDTLYKIFGVAIFAILVMMILRKESSDSALTLRMVVGVGLAIACISCITPIISYVNELGEGFGAADGVSSAVNILLKALGVSLLTHICATVCRDCGEGSIAQYVELGGKIEIIVLSLPLIKDIMDMAMRLVEMS